MGCPFASKLLLILIGVALMTIEARLKGGSHPTSTIDIMRDSYGCYVKPSIPVDRRLQADHLRVVHYNAEFLFLDQSTGKLACPGEDCPWANDTEAQAHGERVVSVLKDLDADIINLAEVEGCDEMAWVANQLNSNSSSGHLYTYYMVKGKDTVTGQNVGLLTRIDPIENLMRTSNSVHYPIPQSQCGFTGQGSHSGVSKHYFTSIMVQGMKIALIGAHLIAYPTEHSRCAEREAQATVLRGVVDAYREQGYEVILYGDLNDFDDQVLDINHNLPTSHVLQILKRNDLVSIAEHIEEKERYTDWWDKNEDCKQEVSELSMIDHILVSPGLAQKISSARMYHAYIEYCHTYDSDHWPAVVDLVFPPNTPLPAHSPSAAAATASAKLP